MGVAFCVVITDSSVDLCGPALVFSNTFACVETAIVAQVPLNPHQSSLHFQRWGNDAK